MAPRILPPLGRSKNQDSCFRMFQSYPIIEEDSSRSIWTDLGSLEVLPFRSLTYSLKSYRNPIGKDRLPTTIFQGRTVKLQGCNYLFNLETKRPIFHGFLVMLLETAERSSRRVEFCSTPLTWWDGSFNAWELMATIDLAATLTTRGSASNYHDARFNRSDVPLHCLKDHPT